MTMIDRDGRQSRLACPSLPPPFHLVAGIFEWDALPWRDRIAVLGMAGPLRIARQELNGGTARAASPDETVGEFPDSRRADPPHRARCCGTSLALAALNQQPHGRRRRRSPGFLPRCSVRIRRRRRLPSRRGRCDLTYAEPARAFIEAQGGAVVTGEAARIAVRSDRSLSVTAESALLVARRP